MSGIGVRKSSTGLSTLPMSLVGKKERDSREVHAIDISASQPLDTISTSASVKSSTGTSSLACLMSRFRKRRSQTLDGVVIGEREPENGMPGIKDLLEIECTRKILKKVSVQMRCEENVDFLIAVFECNETKPVAISQVHEITAQYIEFSSPREINIDGDCREDMLRIIQDDNNTSYYRDTEPLFRDAVKHVMKMLTRNCLPEVYKTFEYKKWALKNK